MKAEAGSAGLTETIISAVFGSVPPSTHFSLRVLARSIYKYVRE